MNNFKYDLSDEQVAAFLEGKGTVDDITFLNCLANDIELLETIDSIQEMDDLPNELNELSSFDELTK